MGHLEVLAQEPRPAGGAGASRARAYCASVLRGRGFRVDERPFEYSALPGAGGAPLAGAWAVAVIGAACELSQFRHPDIALFVLGIGGIALSWAGGLLGKRGVLTLPLMRRHSANLEAVRGDGQPRVWLVAHLDSKWQPVPMLLRAISVALLVVCAGATMTLLMEQRLGLIGSEALDWMSTIACLAGLPLMASFVGGRNIGALDNASGVAAVLAAAEMLESTANVGVLITDAEELALAGARAWCVNRTGAAMINCDSVDDVGSLLIMTIGGKPPTRTQRTIGDQAPVTAAELVRVVETAAANEAEPARRMSLLPGVLTDSVAFSDVGWATVTLSRGTLTTLARIHTMRDNLQRLRGTGIDGAARVMARAATDLSRAKS